MRLQAGGIRSTALTPPQRRNRPATVGRRRPQPSAPTGASGIPAAACSSSAARSPPGVAAVIAGLRAFGGSAATKVTDTISDQFGAFPVRSVEDVPDVPAEQWTVKVDGLVDTPLTVDHAQWTSLQRMNETVDFHCVEGWTVDDVRWGGVAPAVLLDQAGVRPEAKYAVFYARGGAYLSTVPLDLVRDPATVLADQLNGQPLPPKHGGPLRLVVPKQLGYKSVKWVERIELTD